MHAVPRPTGPRAPRARPSAPRCSSGCRARPDPRASARAWRRSRCGCGSRLRRTPASARGVRGRRRRRERRCGSPRATCSSRKPAREQEAHLAVAGGHRSGAGRRHQPLARRVGRDRVGDHPARAHAHARPLSSASASARRSRAARGRVHLQVTQPTSRRRAATRSARAPRSARRRRAPHERFGSCGVVPVREDLFRRIRDIGRAVCRDLGRVADLDGRRRSRAPSGASSVSGIGELLDREAGHSRLVLADGEVEHR